MPKNDREKRRQLFEVSQPVVSYVNTILQTMQQHLKSAEFLFDLYGDSCSIITPRYEAWLVGRTGLKSIGTAQGRIGIKWKKKAARDCVDTTRICPTCWIKKDLRTKHCSVCNSCCELMDHHCVWLNKCVGRRNHRAFVVFVILAYIAQMHQAIVILLDVVSTIISREFLGKYDPEMTVQSWPVISIIVLVSIYFAGRTCRVGCDDPLRNIQMEFRTYVLPDPRYFRRGNCERIAIYGKIRAFLMPCRLHLLGREGTRN